MSAATWIIVGIGAFMVVWGVIRRVGPRLGLAPKEVARGLVMVAVVVGAIMLSDALGSFIVRSQTKPRCTHGLSSVGPVAINGGTVSGSTTPVTEPCLP